MTALTDRERFCAMLSTGPIYRADAIVLLTGDGIARCATAAQLYRMGAAPRIHVVGGFDDPPYSLPALQLVGQLYAAGIAPDAITYDEAPRNTREQAVAVIEWAERLGWKAIALVASPEHQYRAVLTFVQAITERHGTPAALRLVNTPASNLHWSTTPEGRDRSRLDLLADEFAKITTYQESGHCASFADGLAYLDHWERPRAA